ncbi:MAG: hypothetical protein ACT4OP_09370 [Actinomycetota bacterium]
MMASYWSGVTLRLAGAVAAAGVGLALITYSALRQEQGRSVVDSMLGGWPFWVAALLVTAAVAAVIRRHPGGASRRDYLIGLLGLVAAVAVARLVPEGFRLAVFVILVAIVLLAPIGRGRIEAKSS